MVTKSIPVDNSTIAPLLPLGELRSLCIWEYLIKRTFVLDITHLNESEEILCAALDKHKEMPVGYCAQNITSIQIKNSSSAALCVEAYLAPKAWPGSVDRKNKNGDLVELMCGLPFQKEKPEQTHKVIVSFLMPKVMLQDEPLVSRDNAKRLKKRLDRGQTLVAVYDNHLNQIDVCKLLDNEILLHNIVTSMCVRIHPEDFCYFTTVTTMRILCWKQQLDDQQLSYVRKVLTKKVKFCIETFLRFLVYYLTEEKIRNCAVWFNAIQSPTPEQYSRAQLSKMSCQLLLFSQGEELLQNLLSTAFTISDESIAVLLNCIKELAKARPLIKEEKEEK